MYVVEHLSSMSVCKLGDGFDFYEYLSKTDEVCLINLVYQLVPILESKYWLRDKWNALKSEFPGQAFLIHCFQETTSQAIVDLEAGTHDFVTFVGEYHRCGPASGLMRSLVHSNDRWIVIHG
mgnify:CR=1 FL=1